MNYTTADYLNQLQQDRQDLADNLTEKGITDLVGDETFTELVPKVLDIPSGGGGDDDFDEKDVTFFDYDGTPLYTYTLAEIQALEELPEPPAHDGLIFQEWNWTLTQLKNENAPVDVAPFYTTSDGKFRIYIDLDDENYLTFKLKVSHKTTDIDWGDGNIDYADPNAEETYISHTYAQTGNYIISFLASAMSFGYNNRQNSWVGGTLQPTDILFNNIQLRVNCAVDSSIYISKIKKIELPDIGDGTSFAKGVAFGYNALANCVNLETITFPKNTTFFGGDYTFSNCKKLKFLQIPKNQNTNSPQYIFNGCSEAKRVSFGKSNYNVFNYMFGSCYSIKKIKIHSGVNSTTPTSPFGSLYHCETFINNSSSLQTTVSGTNYRYIKANLYSGICNGNIALEKFESTTNLSQVTTIPSNAFKNCINLNDIPYFEAITTISNNAFENCIALKEFIFPSTITSIGTASFKNCLNVETFDFSEAISIPTIASDSFGSSQGDPISTRKFIVPDELYEDWIVASNWSTYASYIVKASEA